MQKTISASKINSALEQLDKSEYELENIKKEITSIKKMVARIMDGK